MDIAVYQLKIGNKRRLSNDTRDRTRRAKTWAMLATAILQTAPDNLLSLQISIQRNVLALCEQLFKHHRSQLKCKSAILVRAHCRGISPPNQLGRDSAFITPDGACSFLLTCSSSANIKIARMDWERLTKKANFGASLTVSLGCMKNKKNCCYYQYFANQFKPYLMHHFM
ncbi:hypothetical protein M513_06597 [Trichuris suis]|uniref:Uncharacterized protein n=1 Tax=Trichuris suis TaxID=68888 RepID=A0A085M5R7_9BILA|nr:hypothetical protein M513_06597 [Trichuris suis]